MMRNTSIFGKITINKYYSDHYEAIADKQQCYIIKGQNDKITMDRQYSQQQNIYKY